MSKSFIKKPRSGAFHSHIYYTPYRLQSQHKTPLRELYVYLHWVTRSIRIYRISKETFTLDVTFCSPEGISGVADLATIISRPAIP